MSEVFTLRRQVEFNHCDPAGIVFYPRYFEMISSVVERFFADALHVGWAEMVIQQGFGTPMGQIEARFHAPSSLEDWLEFALSAKRIGNASATLQIEVSCEGAPRLSCEATIVYTNIREGTSAPWPDEMRAQMTRYLSSPPQD
jgi:4-hydroxybenzoyl-CoA thioesterase